MFKALNKRRLGQVADLMDHCAKSLLLPLFFRRIRPDGHGHGTKQRFAIRLVCRISPSMSSQARGDVLREIERPAVPARIPRTSQPTRELSASYACDELARTCAESVHVRNVQMLASASTSRRVIADNLVFNIITKRASDVSLYSRDTRPTHSRAFTAILFYHSDNS